MKRPMFVITSDYTNFLHNEFQRDYFVSYWSDPFGYMWVSFSNFKDIQCLIHKDPKWGIPTVFCTAEAAYEFAKKIGLSRYDVREIL